MKKGLIIEQIFLNVTAGKEVSDVNLMMVDIEGYLTACINESIGLGKKEQFIEAWRAKRAGIPTKVNYTASYFTYPYTLSFNEERCFGYIILSPSPIITDEVFLQVLPESGDNYIPVLSSADAASIKKYSSGVIYWHERDGTNFTVFFENKKEGDVLVKMIPDFYTLSWDSEIAIPDDKLRLAIDMATAYMKGERYGVADDLLNRTDDAIRATGQRS